MQAEFAGKSKPNSSLLQAFIPTGYPESVTSDYLNYQTWDSLQAIFSTLTSLIATKSLLRAYGVGDSQASSLSATITWVLRDGIAMVSNIVYTYYLSDKFCENIKSWRFMADILNDLGYLIDCVAVLVTKEYFIYFAALAAAVKSTVGVTGQSTKFSLTMHFSKWNNESDLSAKDSAQETLVNLVGMVFGYMLLQTQVMEDQLTSWVMLFVFICCHLICNYIAVSSVILCTLSQHRALLLLKEFKRSGVMLSPAEVAAREGILTPLLNSKHVIMGALLDPFEFTPNDADCCISYPSTNKRYPIKVGLHKSINEDLILGIWLAGLLYTDFGMQVDEGQDWLEEKKFMAKMTEKGWKMTTRAIGLSHYRYNPKDKQD